MQRLFFNTSSWLPTRSQWLHAGASIQEEERKRILEFAFREDCISALIGRILLRYVLCLSANVPWGSVSLTRTDKGKPVINKLKTPEVFLDALSNCSFNISHNGRQVVAVSDTVLQLGVDVMKVTEKHGEVDEFFRLMARNFTNNEWETIKSQPDDKSKMAMFYRYIIAYLEYANVDISLYHKSFDQMDGHRHWCLKESFVKAVGKGIGFSLQRLDFHVESDSNISVGVVDSGSSLYIDNVLARGWLFEESMVDEEHCVAVATECHRTPQQMVSPYEDNRLFNEIRFEKLQTKFEKLTPELNETFWGKFEIKKYKPTYGFIDGIKQ